MMSYPEQPSGPREGMPYPPPGSPYRPADYPQYPPPGYPPPQSAYGAQPPYPGYPPPDFRSPFPGGSPVPTAFGPYGPVPQQTTNGMAIASLVCSIAGLATCGLTSIVGVILGVIAMQQINQSGQQGRGLALAGIITGGAVVALGLLYVIVVFGIGVALGA